jgi:hypothetical protein
MFVQQPLSTAGMNDLISFADNALEPVSVKPVA